MLHANGFVLGALLQVDFKFGESQPDPSQIKTPWPGIDQIDEGSHYFSDIHGRLNTNVDQITMKTDHSGFKKFTITFCYELDHGTEF